jgi:hypothetical protein
MDKTVFFTQDGQGAALPLDVENYLNLKDSVITARDKKNRQALGTSGYFGYGFPGMPFDQGPANPDNFCQGEDIVLDTFLYFLGAPVGLDRYTIKVFLKSSLREVEAFWIGELSNGLYSTDRPGFYTVWIPGSVTAELTAGTYYMDIQVKEEVAAGAGPRDRISKLVSYVFNIEYCAMSPKPENIQNSHEHRGAQESIWPNTPNPTSR